MRLAVAAHRRSKMQRERREAEREEGGEGSVAMRLSRPPVGVFDIVIDLRFRPDLGAWTGML